MRIKRRNLVWLGILAALAGVAIFSQGLLALPSLLLLGALTVAGAISLFDLEPAALMRNVQERAQAGKVTSDAREATERARTRGGLRMSDLQIQDVGLIVLKDGSSGLVMQRSRSLSLEDNSARPYITLQVPSHEADRYATIRFEIQDGYGQTSYVHEQKIYLRDGHMNILAEMQMPLSHSTESLEPGDGDLRVSIDGDLVSMLGFTLTPSVQDRWAGRRAAERLTDRPPAEDEPISLEELLRQQNNTRR
ncbi:MAG: hypothetical protein ACOYL5_20570 [Phototrophicaceae bacterium]|jgi:hypothetical protein